MTVPKKRLAPADRRLLILDAAARDFAELGFEKASMRSIARRAGVTTPVLYDHFASKRDLHIALLRREAAALIDNQERAAAEPPGPRLVRALFESFFAWVHDHPYGWRTLFHDTPSDPEVSATLATLRNQFTGQIASFVARAQTPRAEPELTAQAIYGLINGLAAWWWEHREIPAETLTNLAYDFSWNGLSAMTGIGTDTEPGPA